MGEILFMGPSKSGKTLLLKRMQKLSIDHRLTPFDSIPVSKPTEGIVPYNFKFRGLNFVFNELGGGDIENWENYAKTLKAIIYVFDSADLTTVAQNIVWLNRVLTNESYASKPVLVVLSKCDIPDGVRFPAIDNIIGFDRVLNSSRITLMETSSIVGIGISEIFKWIAEQMK